MKIGNKLIAIIAIVILAGIAVALGYDGQLIRDAIQAILTLGG